jgi:hypothetical protein
VCRKEEGAKKREEWVKNWVARKYNKPKFPRGPVPILSGPQVLYTMYIKEYKDNLMRNSYSGRHKMAPKKRV